MRKNDRMSQNRVSMTTDAEAQRGFRVPLMFHPSHDVPDLREAERWFERVFDRKSTSLSALIRVGNLAPRPDYSIWTPISDVYFDTLDPKLYIVDGVQRLPTVEKPHLRRIAWYIDGLEGSDAASRAISGMNAAYRTLKRHGIRVMNQAEELVEGDEAPLGRFGSKRQIFFTFPEETGLSYSFLPPVPTPEFDFRTQPGWVVPKASSDDPLGIERCSHHTVLTSQPERALTVLRDVLGGEVFHEGRNEALGANSLYLHLSGSTIECAVPDPGTAAYADWTERAPNDTYHSLTWKVADLARAERHLQKQGVGIRSRTHDTIVTDPATSLGIPWGFSSTLTPGDPRRPI